MLPPLSRGVSVPLTPLFEYPLSRGAGGGAGFFPAGRFAGGAGGVGLPRTPPFRAPLLNAPLAAAGAAGVGLGATGGGGGGAC